MGGYTTLKQIRIGDRIVILAKSDMALRSFAVFVCTKGDYNLKKEIDLTERGAYAYYYSEVLKLLNKETERDLGYHLGFFSEAIADELDERFLDPQCVCVGNEEMEQKYA